MHPQTSLAHLFFQLPLQAPVVKGGGGVGFSVVSTDDDAVPLAALLLFFLPAIPHPLDKPAIHKGHITGTGKKQVLLNGLKGRIQTAHHTAVGNHVPDNGVAFQGFFIAGLTYRQIEPSAGGQLLGNFLPDGLPAQQKLGLVLSHAAAFAAHEEQHGRWLFFSHFRFLLHRYDFSKDYSERGGYLWT